MTTFLITFAFLSCVILAMSIGVIFGRKPISGSCGGLNSSGLSNCEICGGNPSKCK